jgi:hypothetical protein
VGNVTLPTPVFLAGGALCLVAGYLVGSVAGPDTPARTTAKVVSFDHTSSRLCLRGGSTKDQEGAGSDGTLCGTWRESRGSQTPEKGDRFRFVSVSNSGDADGHHQDQVVIYGDVLG